MGIKVGFFGGRDLYVFGVPLSIDGHQGGLVEVGMASLKGALVFILEYIGVSTVFSARYVTPEGTGSGCKCIEAIELH